ncbi:SPOR domain-containing protein [Roseibium marinum]|uniref:Sporulation related protein n=1 Tax=Roseibium marinum TaxID=281252 RepID=A0A2S3UNT9_9HYPH|nr:SPOR domain-containing protein [Roseibium marinum]POF29375.1 sporulation related protein [Roseibium marinum]
MPGDTRGNERPAVEDPLVELARIVHRNKQSGAHVSGRVENTDYFAALNEVAGEQPAASDTAQGRIEPTFAATGTAQEPTDTAAEEGIFEGTSAAVSSEPAKIHGMNTPASAEISPDRQADVSALWPQQPDIAVSGGATHPVAGKPAEPLPPNPADPYQDYRQFSAPAEIPGAEDRTGLAPSVSLDLEQNLTAELEDELIGALRQSVDETANIAATEDLPQDVDQSPEEHAAYAVHSETGYRQPEFEAAVEVEQSDETGRTEQWEAAPSLAPVVSSDVTAPAVETDSEPRPQRPAIDENDFFAALTATHTEAGAQETARVGRNDDNPAGIDSLFADLDFPDPENRKRTPQAPTSQAAEARVSAAEIDDMTWPAAADSVPQVDEEETPPPPEGYDLDAVARAMQESDPSLSGAGVLPPHTSAEKAAMPHAREKSRRGLFVAAGILGIAVIGAAGFFMTDGDAVQVPSGPPPVISGLQEPLKIYPDKVAAADGNQSGKLIYDRVDGPGTSGPDRLVLPETPVPAELPPAPVGVNGDADLVPGSPKRVRTLVVRPDGTIISEGDPAAAAETPAIPAPSAPSSSGETDTPRVVATTPVISGADQPIAATGPVVSLDNSAAVPLPATPAIVAVNETATEAEASVPVATIPTVLPRKKPDAPVQVARAPEASAAPAPAAPQDGPLNLGQQASTPAPAAPAQTAPAPASTPSASGSIPPGTYIVQVTSQRTSAAASEAYSSLQRRFPAILGNREAVVVSADLGDRGVFYRARIPTGSRDDANSLCESLQSAGGDCFVRRQP